MRGNNRHTRILIFLALLLMSVSFGGCRMFFYGMQQGIGQAKILIKARPIRKVLADENYPDSVKQQLQLIQEIRQFAIDSLGINDSKNYTTFYDQHNKPILWVVVASKPYTLVAYQWKFPFLGKLEYKGFFDKKKAIKESKKIQALGHDTRIGTVGAWSTLGYFKDPILSNILKRSDGQIAELIIHELTHATVFIKGEAQFNENLATFIGEEGAKRFLIYKYGRGSVKHTKYLGELNDNQMFAKHILRGSKQLDSLYAKFPDNMLAIQKDSIKTEMIFSIMQSLDTIHFYNKLSYRHLQKRESLPNNAFFISFKTYRDRLAEFREKFAVQFHSDFQLYMKYLKKL